LREHIGIMLRPWKSGKRAGNAIDRTMCFDSSRKSS
jgi:hypothetical protein